MNTYKFNVGDTVVSHIKCPMGGCQGVPKVIERRKHCVSESGNLYLIERQWLDEGWLGPDCPLEDELTLL